MHYCYRELFGGRGVAKRVRGSKALQLLTAGFGRESKGCSVEAMMKLDAAIAKDEKVIKAGKPEKSVMLHQAVKQCNPLEATEMAGAHFPCWVPATFWWCFYRRNSKEKRMLGSPTSFNDLGHFALNWLQWSTGRECCCWQGIQKSYSEEDDDDDDHDGNVDFL